MSLEKSTSKLIKIQKRLRKKKKMKLDERIEYIEASLEIQDELDKLVSEINDIPDEIENGFVTGDIDGVQKLRFESSTVQPLSVKKKAKKKKKKAKAKS